MNPLTIEEFRLDFPEFTVELYPDRAVQRRLNLGALYFKGYLWSNEELRKQVIGLYTAHYLKLQGSIAQGGSGVNGETMGVVASKSVDGVSVSYDTSQGTQEGAGHYNLTAYGRELWELLQIVGGRVVQL